jgi:hypothetical protein
MIDRLFIAALTFCLLAAGTAAVGSALFKGARPAVQQARMTQVVQLPLVEISGKRADSGAELAHTESTEPAARKVQ